MAEETRVVRGQDDMTVLAQALINLKDAIVCINGYLKVREELVTATLKTKEEAKREKAKRLEKQRKLFEMRKSNFEDHGYVVRKDEGAKHLILKRIVRRKNGKKKRFLKRVGVLMRSGKLFVLVDGELIRCKGFLRFVKKVAK